MKRYACLMFAIGFVMSLLITGILATVLKPEKAQASQLTAYGPTMNLTVLDVPRATLPVAYSNWERLVEIGTFIVINSSSLVEVTYQGNLSYGGDGGCFDGEINFQIRVDEDQLPYAGTGVISYLANFGNSNYLPSTFSGYFLNLSTGPHKLYVYVQESGCPGGVWEIDTKWNDLGHPVAVIKEFLPFGTTYLPTIQR